MSAAPPSFGASSTSKKAVHVKWAGKTIALGTFPASEADEKCARAKALTRAWRSTMRPKPSRDWVMMELERLGVRVVSGRLGRKAGEEEEEKKGGGGGSGVMGGPSGGMSWGNDGDVNSMMAGARRGSMGLSSMMNDGRRGSLGSLGPMVGLESSGDPSAMGRSMGNGFDLGDAQRRSSGLGGIGGLASAGLGGIGMSVNPNQHYEMLKLHHMNLLNEIQETTLMMNLYQQQQLQQQQQQLQQQANAEGIGSDQLSMSILQGQHNGSMDQMFGGQMGQMSHQQRASLGLGGSQLGGSSLMGNFGNQSSQQMMQSHQMQMQQSSNKEPESSPSSRAPVISSTGEANSNVNPDDSDDDDDDEKETDELANANSAENVDTNNNKRSAEEASEAPDLKKRKTEGPNTNDSSTDKPQATVAESTPNTTATTSAEI